MSSIRILMIVFFALQLAGCSHPTPNNKETDKQQIIAMLDSFNIAAAKADYKNYFKYLTTDAVYIGTDATEHWDKNQYLIWAKPYFDRGKAWSFKAIERHIYFGENESIAWFDELLNTQMKICRGSGVVVKKEGLWKIQHYVLSMTVPNSLTDSVVKLKTIIEDAIVKSK